jgi:O2-independent ubiquinone biosynthesis protein UbiV
LTDKRLALTLGPLQFNWSAEVFSDFYARIADEAPVDKVVIGELVCSKRAPFYEDRLPAAIERLQRAGKSVALGSLALVTLDRERRAARELLTESGLEVEINDLSLMNYIDERSAFSIGPLVNTYNEGTLAFLAKKGARSICLPPELPFASVEALAAAGAEAGVGVEVWAYGRTPLAMSGRCYHARAHGLTKDSCKFVCEKDLDGLTVRTLEGKDFLAINGVQTLSYNYCNLIGSLDRLAKAGLTSLRLSPHSGDFVAIVQNFASVLAGDIEPEQALASMRRSAPEAEFSDGFLFRDCGAAPLPSA